MFFPWFTTAMLAIESNGVIGLRLMKMAAGGSGAMREAQLMISEKVDAAIEAGTGLLLGGSPAAMVERYREHVAANSNRLLNG